MILTVRFHLAYLKLIVLKPYEKSLTRKAPLALKKAMSLIDQGMEVSLEKSITVRARWFNLDFFNYRCSYRSFPELSMVNPQGLLVNKTKEFSK